MSEDKSQLLYWAAECHRRKWAYYLDDEATFDALHQLGQEMKAEVDKAREKAEEEK
jgi:hypothetical protein